jgi:hydroxymethylpyrimidine/phosphomethylpyrimidine kinase
MTIAGSDSCGGAGIQADLKTFAANRVFGASAITALTAQNTVGVQAVHVAPVEVVDAQITAVLEDLAISAVKTGMLATAAIIDLVARRGDAGDLPNLVVDPVMVAASGDRLLDSNAESSYRERLFPHALVITPNVLEASLLVDRELKSIADLCDAARELVATGARSALVKGASVGGEEAVDVFFDGATMHELRAPRVATDNIHGSGCTVSAAIAAHLARGDTVQDAVRAAKAFVTRALSGAKDWRVGAGHGPVDHFGWEDERD